MKKFSIIVNSIMIATSMAAVAHAGNDNWTGLYVGGDASFAYNNAKLTSQHFGFTAPSATCNMSSDFLTFSPGVQVGFLHQFAHAFVSGIEANTTFNANQQNSFSCHSQFNADVADRFTFRNQMQTSIKGRLGHAENWNNYIVLPYLTAGASFANLGLKYKNEGGNYYSNNTLELGWLVGAGVEWAFTQHWSLRAEYYFVDYGNAINLKIPTVYGLNDPSGNGHVNLSANNVVMAINYWI